jgi:S-layer homology domain.
MKRKLLSLLLALALLLTLLPQAATPARAEDAPVYSGECGDALTWTFDPDTGTLTIEGSGDMEDYRYDSPAPWNDFMTDIQSLSLPEGLSSIGNQAFEGTWNLQSVSFPANLTRIGSGAFHGAGLYSVVIPAGVTTIESETFFECGSLRSAVIPDTVTYIDRNAFALTSLDSIDIPEGVQGLGTMAFGCIDTVSSVTLPVSLSYIEAAPFCGCRSLEEILVAPGNSDYSTDEYGALYNAEKTVLIQYPNGREGDFSVPEGVAYIGLRAFEGCDRRLTELTLPESLTWVGERAFCSCSALRTVVFPDQVSYVDEQTFLFCPDLEELRFLNPSCEIIGDLGIGNVDLIVRGYSGSTAQHFANQYGFRFLALGSNGSVYSGECGDELTWSFDPDTGTLTIEGYGYMDPYWEFPDIPWSAFMADITAVSLPDGLINIGDMAFFNCTGLREVTIPEHVEWIGQMSFAGCTGLSALTLPASVEGIYFDAFSGCTGLRSVTLPENLSYLSGFAGCTGLSSIKIPDTVISIDDYAFRGCTGLSSIELPPSLERIWDSAFEDCDGLTEVTIPAGVMYVKDYAFADCDRLEAITFLNPLCEINDSCLGYSDAATVYGYSDSTAEVFANVCGNPFVSLGTVDFTGPCGDSLTWTFDPETGVLTIRGEGDMWDFWSEDEPSREIPWHALAGRVTELQLNKGLRSIGEHAFQDCTGLSSVTIPAGVTAIRDRAFADCYNLTTVELPEGITYLSGFAYCYSLTDVTIPKSVTVLGHKAFCSCEQLTEIEIPEGVTYIGWAAFRDCYGLTEVTLPGAVTEVESEAFCRCYGLTEMTFPASVNRVGSWALEDCPALRTVTFLDPVCDIGWGCLADSYRVTVYGYNGSTAQIYAEDWDLPFVSLGDAEIGGRCGDKLTWTFNTETGTLAIKGSGDMWDFDVFDENDNYIRIPWESFQSRITAIDLPDGLTRIGKSAFQFCFGLSEVVIPGSVNSIGARAFTECDGLTELVLSEGLTAIEADAFFHCTGLRSVSFPKSLRTLNGFYGCSELQSITIPEGVTTICAYAFADTQLRLVVLPESLETVSCNAFEDCYYLCHIVFRNPACKVQSYESSNVRGDSGSWEMEYDETLGLNWQTKIYALHDPEKEDADEMLEPVTDEWGSYLYGYRYVENYAKHFGYTFCATNVFSDVRSGKFYEIPVAWAYAMGITSGMDETHFAPNEVCTRGQVVTFLWNALYHQAPTVTDCPFEDVTPGKYYYEAMLWAYGGGITSGIDETHFAPNESCTRAQVVTFLWNAWGQPEPTITDCPFVDVTPGKYYYKAMLWALENGITAGLDETHFGPSQPCTRGQVVTFLFNFAGFFVG